MNFVNEILKHRFAANLIKGIIEDTSNNVEYYEDGISAVIGDENQEIIENLVKRFIYNFAIEELTEYIENEATKLAEDREDTAESDLYDYQEAARGAA